MAGMKGRWAASRATSVPLVLVTPMAATRSSKGGAAFSCCSAARTAAATASQPRAGLLLGPALGQAGRPLAQRALGLADQLAVVAHQRAARALCGRRSVRRGLVASGDAC